MRTINQSKPPIHPDYSRDKQTVGNVNQTLMIKGKRKKISEIKTFCKQAQQSLVGKIKPKALRSDSSETSHYFMQITNAKADQRIATIQDTSQLKTSITGKKAFRRIHPEK